MLVKLSKFKSNIHDVTKLNNITQQFIKSVEKALKSPIKYTDDIADYQCDLKLIYIESGGSEGYFLRDFRKLKEPYIFITSGANNSLAASLEILTYLNLHHKKGELLHGDPKSIAERIQELAMINRVRQELNKQRLGIIGKPSDWLISSIPNYQLVKKRFGVTLIDIPIKEVETYAKTMKKEKTLNIKGQFDLQELRKADHVYQALDKIIHKYRLTGLTTRCFDLLTSLKTTACLGLSALNDRKIIATCEGDITAMLSMKIASLIGDGYTFQANPSRIDIKNNSIVLAHCTIPTKMLTSYRLDTHFESGIGVAIKGELKTTDVTMFRLSSNLKDYFVAEGKIIRNLSDKNLCRTQIEIKFKDKIDSLLKNPCGNHHIIFYGHHKQEIETLMRSL